MSIDPTNDFERKMKDRSEQNFLSCPFPCALGKDMMTQKPEKKISTTACYSTMRDQHFDLFWATVAGRTMKEMVSHLWKGW
jgi:hypothetical protein